jgi:hypothetical protein
MRTALSRSLVLLTALASPACQQVAGAQQVPVASSTAHHRASDAFVEGETCMRSDDCPRAARCFDGRCLPTTRSLQGEVLAERGTRALASGRFPQAAEAFREAERVYTERQIAVPSSVSCGLARALVALTDRGAAGDAREATARSLSTCLATAPRGSASADQALASLAALSDRGLEVAALDRPDAPLMTGRDPRPTADNTRAQIVFATTGEGARDTMRQLLAGDAVRQEVIRCFLQWWEVSRQGNDQGALRVTYTRALDDYDELMAPRVTVTAADIAPSAADAGTTPHWLQCSAAAIQAAAASQRWPARRERWAEPVMLTVGPQ